MDFNSLIQILVDIIASISVFVLGFKFLFKEKLSYLEEKGKNSATKEDINKITEEIESVKKVYREYGFRYKKEYEILCEISAGLFVLKKH